jgi:formate hydrogenlyase transcriptional activator
LYYRLNVFPIKVPALRERKEDISLLVRHFVQEFSRRSNRVINTIPSETMEVLVRYHWPGNKYNHHSGKYQRQFAPS